EVGGADKIEISIGMVGVHNSSFPVNLVHLWNGGPEEGWLAVQLKPGTGVRIEELKERLRGVLARDLPDMRISFEPQDIVTRVMSFGSPTPIEIAVSGSALPVSKAYADRIIEKLKAIPYLRDIQIAQTLDYPSVAVHVDRERAGQLGVQMSDVTRSLVAATTSSRFTVPVYWADPNSGISFNVQVQIPEDKTRSIEDLQNVPITSSAGAPILLRNLATFTPGTSVGTYERYNLARLVSITANLHGSDLGTATRAIKQAIKEAGPAPEPRTKVDLRGQIVPLEQLHSGFRSGLIITVVVIFLMLMANFQSVRLALAVVSTVPAVLVGVVLALHFTGTTLNIQSAMGAIMSVGVAVANAILLVTFAEKSRVATRDPVAAAIEGGRTRLRPILMTSCAMIAGMLPLAVGLGEGGDQTSPLGRAVVGGLAVATFATIFVLPSMFAIVTSRQVRSPSLDPEDPESVHYSQSRPA
ncbi:MAG: efflux RND transporter permease subunit, partial [Verrucomicrobia bacterium]|nr:efflux RND transporter permease subunit [Verrucomicrobiota bacterium]